MRFWQDVRDVWLPPLQPNLFALPKSPCDIAFLVDGKVFKAHKLAFTVRSSNLADFATTEQQEGPVSIEGVSAELFQNILDCLYTGSVQSKSHASYYAAWDLLVVADRFACSSLKLELEALIAAKFFEDLDAPSILLAAYSHNCALSKELALSLTVFPPSELRVKKRCKFSCYLCGRCLHVFLGGK